MAIGVIEDRLDGCEIFTGADQIRRRTSAKEEANGLDHDRFAGAGLSGQDVERMFKLD